MSAQLEHKRTTVVIPLRETDNPYTTLSTLRHPCEIVIAGDEGKGANFARNKGFRKVRTEFVLFSDCDIEWELGAVDMLEAALELSPLASFAYGSYEMGGKVHCDVAFDADRLQRNNYISTMSLIRTEHFPGFDEEISRLQDWDLWLTLLEQGRSGVYARRSIFTTEPRAGITFGGGISWEDARAIVARKHGLS